MNILFLNYVVNKEKAETLSGVSIAGNKMQMNILKNLVSNKEINVKSITLYPIASYPNDKKIYIKTKEISIIEEITSIRIGFLNLKLIKQVWQTLSVYNQAKKLINDDTIILSFNAFPQIGIPLMLLKKKFNSKIVSILADLPIDDKVGRKGISLLARKYFDKLTRKSILSCDKLIVLNKHAIELFAPETRYIVVEGGIDIGELRPVPEKNYMTKNIVYSGALTQYSGVVNLIESMKSIEDKDVFLDIYGSGQMEGYVNECANKMNNVFFHGRVDNHTMMKKQSEAFLLVNPRPVNDPIAMVTFPSKIFEYMISGTPVLTTKLNGFSEDYLDKMFFVDNNKPHTLANALIEIINLPEDELRKKASLSREFIVENKTWVKQCEKIYNFLMEEAMYEK